MLSSLRDDQDGYVSSRELAAAINDEYKPAGRDYIPIHEPVAGRSGADFVFVRQDRQAELRAAMGTEPKLLDRLSAALAEAERQKQQAKIQTLLANARLKDSETQPHQAFAFSRAGASVEGQADGAGELLFTDLVNREGKTQKNSVLEGHNTRSSTLRLAPMARPYSLRQMTRQRGFLMLPLAKPARS